MVISAPPPPPAEVETESQGGETARSELAWGRVSSCPRFVWFPRRLLKLLGTTGCVLSHSVVSDSAWTVARQALLSTGFFRQEYWSWLPFPPPGIFPVQGSNPRLLCLLQHRQILYPRSPQGRPGHWRSLAISTASHPCSSGHFALSCPLSASLLP